MEPQINIHAIEAGPENPARTLVFIHGYGGWAEQWLYQMECFGRENRVIALDLRGHSKSDKPHSKYTNIEFLTDFDSAFEKLHIDRPFTLIGHSYGAALAAEYAAANPRAIQQLVLLNVATSYSVPFYLSLPFLVPNFIFDAVLNLINRIRQAYAAPSYVLKSIFWNSLSTWDGESVFANITTPSLILAPESDPILSQKKMNEVPEKLNNSLHEIVPTRSHMTMTKQPQFVNNAISRFLQITGCD